MNNPTAFTISLNERLEIEHNREVGLIVVMTFFCMCIVPEAWHLGSV